MVPVRSVSSSRWMSGEIQLVTWGSSAFTRSTVSMTLASAVLVTVRMMAGFVPWAAATRLFATPSTTSATSDSRTTPPFALLSTRRP